MSFHWKILRIQNGFDISQSNTPLPIRSEDVFHDADDDDDQMDEDLCLEINDDIEELVTTIENDIQIEAKISNSATGTYDSFTRYLSGTSGPIAQNQFDTSKQSDQNQSGTNGTSAFNETATSERSGHNGTEIMALASNNQRAMVPSSATNTTESSAPNPFNRTGKISNVLFTSHTSGFTTMIQLSCVWF